MDYSKDLGEQYRKDARNLSYPGSQGFRALSNFNQGNMLRRSINNPSKKSTVVRAKTYPLQEFRSRSERAVKRVFKSEENSRVPNTRSTNQPNTKLPNPVSSLLTRMSWLG